MFHYEKKLNPQITTVHLSVKLVFVTIQTGAHYKRQVIVHDSLFLEWRCWNVSVLCNFLVLSTSLHTPSELLKKSLQDFKPWLFEALISRHSSLVQVMRPPSTLPSLHTQPIELLKSVTCSLYICLQLKIFCYSQSLRHWTDGCGEARNSNVWTHH